MEVKEIQERQNRILQFADGNEGEAAAVAATLFWLSEIALQLARANQGNGAK